MITQQKRFVKVTVFLLLEWCSLTKMSSPAYEVNEY